MASSGRENMANKLASKEKSSDTTAYILKSNRCRRKRRGEKKRKKVEVEKLRGRRRTARRVNQI